jgi:methyl-accepting chemotaxis protein
VLKPVTTLITVLVLAGLAMLAVAISWALLFTPSIANPILRLIKAANQLAAGDLSVQAKVGTKDEIGELAGAFNNMADQLRYNISNEREQRKHIQETIDRYVEFTNKVMQGKLGSRLQVIERAEEHDDPLLLLGKSLNEMTENLHRMIAQTTEAAANLSSATTEILAATTQQASGATEQSAAITQTTSTVNEVKTISEQASMRLKDVASASQRTVDVARSGQKAVQEMIESMSLIKERVEAIAENTLALSEQTQQIGEIITTVNEIAAQSNILALNASVEAARAGEHGKGFAVVAMEVRNLAEQSKQATAQVRTILSEIQKATNSTVMATEEGAKGVDAGVILAAQTRESIEKLSSAVNEATQVAMQVVAGGQQLQTGIDQIAMAIQQINQVTIQSLASTRETEKSAQNLNELARRLNDNVTQYQL